MATKAKASPQVRPLGTAGTYIASGVVQTEEDNAKLRSDLARGSVTDPGEYHRMARQDPEIAGGLRAITSVLLGASVTIEPPDDATPAEVTQAEFVDACWKGIDGGPRKFMREALSFLPMGFSLFEEVYRRDASSGQLVWWKFAQRLQRTVQRWHVDPESDELSHVTFYAPFGGDQFKSYEIPSWALTHFALDQQGNNFEGVSLLRPAYTPWLMKRQVIRGTAIDVERAGAGFMKFLQTQQGEQVTNNDHTRASDTARNWRANAASHALLPYGWDLQFEFPKIPFADRAELLRYLDQQISKTFLASFMQLGMASAGTQSLGDVLVDLFLRSLRALADYFEDTMNGSGGLTVSGPIRRLVDYNFGPQERYPVLRIGSLSREKASTHLGALAEAKVSGILGPIWSSDDINRTRKVADLEPLDEEAIEEAEEKAAEEKARAAEAAAQAAADGPPAPNAPPMNRAGAPPQGNGAATDGLPPRALSVRADRPYPFLDVAGAPMASRRPVLDAERVVAFSEIARLYVTAEEDFESVVRPVLDRGAREVALDVRRIVHGADDLADKLAAIALLGLSAGAAKKLAAAVQAHLLGVAERAASQARAEVTRQVLRVSHAPAPAAGVTPKVATPVAVSEMAAVDLADVATAQASLVARRLADTIGSSLRDAGARGAMAGPTGAARAVLDADRAVEALSPGFFRGQAAQAVGQTVTAARESGAKAALVDLGVQRVAMTLYSAMLDDVTCEPCAEIDGSETPLGSDEYWRTLPPYQNCAGRGRCRCIKVIVPDMGEDVP